MSVKVMENRNKSSRVRYMTHIGMLSAASMILMLFEIPLPFAPEFYKIDLSEIPVLIGGFAMGPLAAVLIELIKIILNLLINNTVTAGVGEMANFAVGCAFVVPAALIYKKRKTKKGAIIGLITGTVSLVVVGCFLNAYILLPVYAKAFKIPLDAMIAEGTAINGNIRDIMTFVLYAVAPFNLVKGIVVSVLVMLVYKRISPLLKI